MSAASALPSAGRRRAAAGFSLVEVLISMVALALAGASVMQGILVSAGSVSRAEAASIAIEVARGMGDRIAATPIDEVAAIWGPDGTEGPTFEVEALTGLAGRTATGRVWVVTDETETAPDLVRTFGMPRDLDGDGAATKVDVAATAHVLPVLIEVRWGPAGADRFRLPVVVVR